MIPVLFSAFDALERSRLEKALARSHREGREEERDRLIRGALDRVDADMQALRDMLGYGKVEEDEDDSSDVPH